ncbi:LytR/AlgR family response regulator transcription factor [Mangrovivirga cuniculi]|uniref:DNA-binding response regulator n=1 Tax=Mangrovivirga cuniculi TaxID=2715131 RepID=A0A4D7K650_9BACT|nr:LytTR family DNA-binding domain-containing protein [Mangrovivirga cuniculi]QCK14888.1 DNA-binding response regulator [Mangrovivirga cuniculi]
MDYRCMIVDDEALSRGIAKNFVEKTKGLTLTYECSSAIEAINFLQEDDVDILLVDINMPEMTGMELMKSLDENYQVILITGDENYAIEAFENSATDYLVKPIEYSRFIKAINKAKANIDAFRQRNERFDEIYVKSDSKLVRLQLDNIYFIEALADYVMINTANKKYIVHSTMKGLINRLPQSMFVRVHRSYIVNTKKIESLEDLNIVIKDKYIPVGASYKESFMKRLNILK